MSGTRYQYTPIIDRPAFLWPGEAEVALWVIPNVEYYPFGNAGPSVNERAASAATDVLNNTWREYGVRVGVWRLIDCFDRTGVKVSATLNSEVCDWYPQIIEAGCSRSWEWLGHGTNNTIRLSELSPDQERQVIRSSTTRIARATGQRPRGWLGPSLGETANTPDILYSEGYEYVCDWLCDDLPLWLSVLGGRVLSVPYSIELNDMQLILRQRSSGEEYARSLTDHFEQLKREAAERHCGRVMAIPLHPFLTGQARFVPYLERALRAIVESGHAWVATGSEIADYFARVGDR